MKPFFGLRVRRIVDVVEVVGGGRHVVGRAGEAKHARSPRAIIIVGSLHCLLLCKFHPLPLELCLGGLQVRLPGLQARHLLLKVVCPAARTLVLRRELGGVIGGVVAIDEEALTGRRVVVDVVGVILQAIP